MSNELGSADISQALQGRYETRGEAPIFALGSELFPMVGASDTLRDPELHFPHSRLCCATGIDDAVAGQISHVHLTNPPNSGVIIVLIGMWVKRDTVPFELAVAVEGGPLSVMDTSPAGFLRDSRYGWSTARSLGQVGNHTSVGSIGTIISRVDGAVADDYSVNICPLILGPQSRVLARNLSTNNRLLATFVWRERKIEGGELRNAR